VWKRNCSAAIGSCGAVKFGWPASAVEIGDAAHGALALWAGQNDREREAIGVRMFQCVEQGAHGGEALLRRGAEPTIGADAAKTLGQDVLEEAMEKGLAAEGECPLGVSFRLAIADGDAPVALMEEALAGEGGPGDVAGEIT